MCESAVESGAAPTAERGRPPTLVVPDTLLAHARFVADEPEIRRTAAGFIGYGATKPGDRVLLAADTHFDPLVVEAMTRALREKGAAVDVIVVQAEPDREFEAADELRAAIRRRPWREQPRRWEGLPWVEELALARGYDLLVHGKGGGIPATPHRYEAFPWLRQEQLASPATTYPREVHALINRRAWEPFWEQAPGGRVRVTDPEGTDIAWDMWPEYFEHPTAMFGPVPRWNHLMSHPPTPLSPRESSTGVVRGTLNHFGRPYPPVAVHVEAGRVERVDGGGEYGALWRELLAEAKAIQYPCFPRPGLFWMWECAIGTNPKIARPRSIRRLSSGGFEWERRRSGIVHLGFGTQWRGPEERWAGEAGLVYGHLHVHLNFATITLTAADGRVLRLLERGRLLALDDPEVRALAGRHGDPEALLRVDWEPKVPGLNAAGDYADYARDPAGYIYSEP